MRKNEISKSIFKKAFENIFDKNVFGDSEEEESQSQNTPSQNTPSQSNSNYSASPKTSNRLGEVFSNAINKTKSESKRKYEDLDKGKAVTFHPKSDRYTYENREDTNYDKNWKPRTKEEKESLSPEGYHRVGERKEVKKGLKGDMDEDTFNDTYTEKQISVPSTMLKTLKYDPENKIVSVQFQSGKKWYEYPQVPLELVQAVMKSNSKGEAFWNLIHDDYTLNPGHKSKGNKNNHYKKYFKQMRKVFKSQAKERKAMERNK